MTSSVPRSRCVFSRILSDCRVIHHMIFAFSFLLVYAFCSALYYARRCSKADARAAWRTPSTTAFMYVCHRFFCLCPTSTSPTHPSVVRQIHAEDTKSAPGPKTANPFFAKPKVTPLSQPIICLSFCLFFFLLVSFSDHVSQIAGGGRTLSYWCFNPGAECGMRNTECGRGCGCGYGLRT